MNSEKIFEKNLLNSIELTMLTRKIGLLDSVKFIKKMFMLLSKMKVKFVLYWEIYKRGVGACRGQGCFTHTYLSVSEVIMNGDKKDKY